MAPTVRKHRRVVARGLKVACKSGGLLQAILSRQSAHVARILDCSEGGMRVLADHPLKPGQEVRLALEVSFMHGRIRLKAKILRCRSRQRPGKPTAYEVGLSIPDPSPAYVGMLKRLREDPMLRQGTL